MVGEKRKHGEVEGDGDNSHSQSQTDGGCRTRDVEPAKSYTVTCECYNQTLNTQKRPCLNHRHPVDATFSDGSLSSCICITNRMIQNGHWTYPMHTAQAVPCSTEGDMDTQEQSHNMDGPSHVSLVPGIIPDLFSVGPKRCQRCESGQSGHINHILS